MVQVFILIVDGDRWLDFFESKIWSLEILDQFTRFCLFKPYFLQFLIFIRYYTLSWLLFYFRFKRLDKLLRIDLSIALKDILKR